MNKKTPTETRLPGSSPAPANKAVEQPNIFDQFGSGTPELIQPFTPDEWARFVMALRDANEERLQ